MKDSLVTNSGYLNTGSYTLTLDSAAWLKEHLAGNSEVIGAVTSQRYLPGNNVRYKFANIGCDIQLPTVPAGMVTVTRNTGTNAVITSMSTGNSGIARNFTITPTLNQGHLGAHLWLYYSDAELLNGVDTTNMMMFRKGGVTWEYLTSIYHNPVVINTVAHNINRGAIDSFSQWTIGSSITPLPVSLINFSATLLSDRQTVSVNWATAQEMNNDHFIVERSIDGGKTYTEIGIVKGNGTTNTEHSYSFMDKHVDLLLACDLYYRLKQVDVNGAVNDPGAGVKEVVVCQSVTLGNNDKVWYNQSEDRVYMNLERTSQMSVKVVLTDDQGKVITSQNIGVNNGITQASLNMAGLAKGIYSVSITDIYGTQTKRIMKF